MPQKKFGYRKGDRVQHTVYGNFGTVYQDQTDPANLQVNWDKYPGQIECVTVRNIRVAPWHEIINPMEFDVDMTVERAGSIVGGKISEQYGGAVKAAVQYKKGDRVKLKYNRNTGTVTEDQPHYTGYVPVQWDQSGKLLKEPADALVPLHTPRDTDPVNPNQEAIDAIEVQRAALKRDVEALQSRLSALTAAKRLLERG